MTAKFNNNDPHLLTRRDIVAGAFKTMLIASILPASLTSCESAPGPASTSAAALAAGSKPYRSINIMNFIRAEEPRNPMDLITPVREQMALSKAHNFPTTWLLQYDALVEGPFVEFLKAEMPADHEVGLWFEMNRKICDDAGVAWRGRSDWEWDYHVPVAYSIGYTPEERRKLVDAAMTTFKRVFGKDIKSVACWNMEAISAAYFADKYDVDAFGNCRDQLATDGFTVWGAPIAGYYPNRLNALSPAVEAKNQISTPMFRLLGQDPVYYYDNTLSYPDTMEPVWATGRSEKFVDTFLDMIARQPTQAFGYAQLGQENSFGWDEMKQAFPMQMEKLAKERDAGGLVVETMGETGRRFKRAFKSTPTQAQVMLEDPFGTAGASDRQLDATAAVKALVQNDALRVTVNNDLVGDPANNTHKYLQVSYTLDGAAHSQTGAELETIQIPGPGETPGKLVITKAVYGVLDRAPERTVWYQSKLQRANLHFRGDQFFLRDLHVYNDKFPQPFLTETVKQHGIEQRLLAVLDGYHWSDDKARSNNGGARAMGRFVLVDSDGKQTPLTMDGLPTVTETGSVLKTKVPLAGGGAFIAAFHESEIELSVVGAPANTRLGLIFEWDPDRSALREVTAKRLSYRFQDFDYSMSVANGAAVKTDKGANIIAGKQGALRLLMAQK
jgi:hypothetical protein